MGDNIIRRPRPHQYKLATSTRYNDAPFVCPSCTGHAHVVSIHAILLDDSLAVIRKGENGQGFIDFVTLCQCDDCDVIFAVLEDTVPEGE